MNQPVGSSTEAAYISITSLDLKHWLQSIQLVVCHNSFAHRIVRYNTV